MPYAYEELKRILNAREIRIESLGQAMSPVSTISLEPQGIPLDVKVILLGERRIYYMLCTLDPEFDELFKVSADFEDDIDRNDRNTGQYVNLIGTLARKEKLRPQRDRARPGHESGEHDLAGAAGHSVGR